MIQRTPHVILAALAAAVVGLRPGTSQQEPARAAQPAPQGPPVELPTDQEAGNRGLPIRELTLEDALRLGRGSNVELRAAELLPLQAQQRLLEVEAVFLPELYGDVGYGDARTPSRNQFQPSITRTTLDATVGWRQRVTTGGLFDLAYRPVRVEQSSSLAGAFPERQFASEWSVSYTQPLLRGAWTDFNLAEVNAARYQQARARHEFDRVIQDTLLLIVQSYWELAFARENYRVVLAALAVAREQLRITEERIRVRDLAPRNRIADEAEVARQQEQLIGAEIEIRRREDGLRRLLFDDQQGQLWRVNLRPVSPIAIAPEVAPLGYEQFAEVALAQRPDLKALRNDVAVAEVDLMASQRNELPQLDLVGGYSSDGVDDQFHIAWRDSIDQEFPDWSLRLQFRIPIGNQAARAARERAALELERRKRVLYGAMMDVQQEVRDAVRTLESLAQSIRASGESVRLAESNLETEQINLRVGLSTAFEVQRRNQALQEARVRHLRNQLDYRVAESRLLHVQGVLEVPAR